MIDEYEAEMNGKLRRDECKDDKEINMKTVRDKWLTMNGRMRRDERDDEMDELEDEGDEWGIRVD